ncbi:hypothetical protein V8E55_008178 [Tylopilus felleus]
MTSNGIPLDKAELLSVILEAILYGFSLLMFGGTMWTLLSQRSIQQLNRKMFAVACALLVVSTAHLVVHIIRVMFGLILYRDTFPGGPAAYFLDVSEWTWNAKNHIYVVQSLIGDGVILYRCYAVWQTVYILIVPMILWCVAGVSGFMANITAAHATQSGVFAGVVQKWITSFWAATLATNLLATVLLIARIWYVDWKATRFRSHQSSQLRPILHILIDAGAFYSLTLVVALICFVNESNGQYVILDMVTPIISITFYMVIIRVGMASRSAQLPFRNMSLEASLSAERRRRMQVHITTLTENKIEHDQRPSSMCITVPSNSKSDPSDIQLDSDGYTPV